MSPRRRAPLPALALVALLLGTAACTDGGMTAGEEGTFGPDASAGGGGGGSAASEAGEPAQAPNLEAGDSAGGTVDPAAAPGSATGDPDIQPSPTFEPQEDEPDSLDPTD